MLNSRDFGPVYILHGIQGILDPSILILREIHRDLGSWNTQFVFDPGGLGSWNSEFQCCMGSRGSWILKFWLCVRSRESWILKFWLSVGSRGSWILKSCNGVGSCGSWILIFSWGTSLVITNKMVPGEQIFYTLMVVWHFLNQPHYFTL